MTFLLFIWECCTMHPLITPTFHPSQVHPSTLAPPRKKTPPTLICISMYSLVKLSVASPLKKTKPHPLLPKAVNGRAALQHQRKSCTSASMEELHFSINGRATLQHLYHSFQASVASFLDCLFRAVEVVQKPSVAPICHRRYRCKRSFLVHSNGSWIMDINLVPNCSMDHITSGGSTDWHQHDLQWQHRPRTSTWPPLSVFYYPGFSLPGPFPGQLQEPCPVISMPNNIYDLHMSPRKLSLIFLLDGHCSSYSPRLYMH